MCSHSWAKLSLPRPHLATFRSPHPIHQYPNTAYELRNRLIPATLDTRAHNNTLNLPSQYSSMKHRQLSRQDAADEQWEEMYNDLVAYYTNHGNTSVPSTFKNKLSYWVTSQREAYRNNMSRMTRRRIAQLNKMSFDWGMPKAAAGGTGGGVPTANDAKNNGRRWQEMYDQLRAYKLENGHCKVPLREYMKNSKWGPLGGWVSRQRLARDTLPLSRKALLDDVGFVWCADNWDAMYDRLAEYHTEHGNTHVSACCYLVNCPQSY